MRFDQFMNESSGCLGTERETFMTNGESQPQGDMSLAEAGIAECDHVLPAGRPARSRIRI